MTMPLDPMVLAIPGSEIQSAVALAGATMVASFAFCYACLRFLIDVLRQQTEKDERDREVRAKEAEAMKEAMSLANAILRDRRVG